MTLKEKERKAIEALRMFEPEPTEKEWNHGIQKPCIY